MDKPYDPLEKLKDKIVCINFDEYVNADVYSEQLDFVYTISHITLAGLIKIFQHDKHLYLNTIEYFND